MASVEKNEIEVPAQDHTFSSLGTAEHAVPIPRSLVPTPTYEYRNWQRSVRVGDPRGWAGITPVPIPIPIPIPVGARVLMWKQDPTVTEIGIRKAFLPNLLFTGPRDARIMLSGLPAVSPNVLGDFIASPGTDAFDSVHTFTVVRQTLTMYQRALAGTVPWQWNLTPGNVDPITVFPHAGVTMNAFYSRSLKALKFFFFTKPGSTPPQTIFTCRSLDIVAHETGHAVLDGIQPNWLSAGNPPQTGALHESFGDLTAIFLALSQFDQIEALIAQTKSNLHDKTFLSDLAEQFGLALGRTNGLRNADNDLKLSQVGNEVHDLSQIFTGGIYDVLADIFAFERRPALRDDSVTLFDAAAYLRGLLLRALKAAPAAGATFASVINQMLSLAAADGKPVQYRNFIRNQFTRREVVVSPTPLTRDHSKEQMLLEPEGMRNVGPQNRAGCCGTMRHEEYTGGDHALNDGVREFEAAMKDVWAGTAR